jgi:hypothetical protein
MAGVVTTASGLTLTGGEIAAAAAGGCDAAGMLQSIQEGSRTLAQEVKALAAKIGAGSNATALTGIVTNYLT